MNDLTQEQCKFVAEITGQQLVTARPTLTVTPTVPGDMWFNTSTQQLHIYDGNRWVTVR